MGYKRKKSKLKTKISEQSDDLNNGVDQLELKVSRIEEHFNADKSDIELGRQSKRIKLETSDIGDDPVLQDLKQVFSECDIKVNIKP